MKIYVIGDLEQARAMLENPHQAQPVNHCSAIFQGDRSTRTTDVPDWIVIEGNALSSEGMALVQSLRAMGFSSPPTDARLSRTQVAGRDEGQRGHPIRGARCLAAQPPYRYVLNTADPDSVPGNKALVYEYQAPPRRRNN